MADSVTQWLEQLGLGQYTAVFEENGIDWSLLPKLDHELLKEMGITAVGHRMQILEATAVLDSGRPFCEPEPEQQAASGGAERRQLTVMFCDLVGSTELSQQLDAEDLREVNRAYQDACKIAIERYEGYVAKYMGDGVLAYFGYPQAHEDDAERAVQAGLRVVREISGLNETIGSKVGADLGVRVGIATGPVVVGDLIGEGASQENAVVGETPNLAARLQTLASRNAVVIAPGTHELVKGRFEYENLGEHNLKGISEPVHAWRIIAPATAESRFDSTHQSDLTPLVGREHEIALLTDRWEQVKEGEGQVVLLSGEAGIGKSRITQALKQTIATDDVIRLQYQCSPHHRSSALYPVISQLARAARIERNLSVDSKLDKLENLLMKSAKNYEEVIPFFAALLSIPAESRYPQIAMSPEQQKSKTLEALVEQLKNLSEQCPVLMIFEDAHWSDPTSIELLSLIIEEAQDFRVLLLITFRPEFIPPWTGHTHITGLTLNRFSKGQVISMIERVTTDKALPDEVRDQIIEKTDGVPLFVEELTKTVLESNLIEDKGDHYALSKPLPPLAIPNTLQDSLMARLDRLAPVKETAQIAALLGREFKFKLLSKISPLDEDLLAEALQQLSNSELVFSKGTPPNSSYVFKHAMVQDVAYESLLKSKRRELHARVASALQEENAEPEILARHYSEAGLFDPAVKSWLKAGQQALERSANLEAANHLQKGLDLIVNLPESSESRLLELELQLALGPALMAIKGYASPQIEPVYGRARELCQKVGNLSQSFAATWGLWLHYQQGGKLMQARNLTEEVLAIAEKHGNKSLLLQAHHAAWATFHRLGELDACQHHAEKGVGLYDVSKHSSHAYLYGGHDPGVCAQTHAGIALWCLGFPDQALERALNGLSLSEQLSHPFSRVDALFGGARIYLFRREHALAQACAKEMISLSVDHEFSLMEAWGTIIQGSAIISEEKDLGVIGEMRRSIAVTRDTGAQAHVPYLLSLLIDAYLRTDQVEIGLEIVADALQLIEKTGERNWEAEIFRQKGELLLKQTKSDKSEIENCFRRALEIATTQNAKSLALRSAISLAHISHGQKKCGDAGSLLKQIYGWFTEGFVTADLKEAKALL